MLPISSSTTALCHFCRMGENYIKQNAGKKSLKPYDLGKLFPTLTMDFKNIHVKY